MSIGVDQDQVSVRIVRAQPFAGLHGGLQGASRQAEGEIDAARRIAQLRQRDALRAHRARYAAQPADATKLITFGESKPDTSLPAPEVAAWTLTASLLLNLDETLNR